MLNEVTNQVAASVKQVHGELAEEVEELADDLKGFLGRIQSGSHKEFKSLAKTLEGSGLSHDVLEHTLSALQGARSEVDAERARHYGGHLMAAGRRLNNSVPEGSGVDQALQALQAHILMSNGGRLMTTRPDG